MSRFSAPLLLAVLAGCPLTGLLAQSAPARPAAFVPASVAEPATDACRQSRLRDTAPGVGQLPANRTTSAFRAFEQLMNRYDVTSARLDLGLERTDNLLRPGSNVLTRARNVSATTPLDTIGFELNAGLTVDSLWVNGRRVPTARIERLTGGLIRTPVQPAIAPGATFTYRIWYRGAPGPTGGSFFGQGLTSVADPQFGNRVTWTLSSPFATSDWCPSKQVLTDKLDSVTVLVSTAPTNKVGSNGRLRRTDALPDGRVRYEWATVGPIAYYLISATVSDFVEHRAYAHPAGLPTPADSVLVLSYVYPNALAPYRAELDRTAGFIEAFSDKFGLYPFWREKYGHAMASIGGGMEHQTMSTMGGFSFTLTAHELCHQWFGDHVTCGSYRDMWLNEGFATYGEYVALQALATPANARQWLDYTRGQALATNASVVVPPTADTLDVARIFDGRSTYAKGGIVLHMLRHVRNDDAAFFAGLRTYQQQYGGRTAVTADLRRSLEASWGIPLGWFFNQWLTGAGAPRVAVRWNQVGENLVIESTQTVSLPNLTPFFRMPLEIDYVPGPGRAAVTVRVEQTQPVQTWTLPLAPGDVASTLAIDPRGWNLLSGRRIQRDVGLVLGLNPDATSESARLAVYPNPCTDLLTLPAAPHSRTAEVTDLTGRHVLTVTLPAGTTQLATAALPAGTYALRVIAPNGTTQRVRFSRQ